MRHFCDIGLHNCNFLLDYNDLTRLSFEMLKGYMLICCNAEGVHGQTKVVNPCARQKYFAEVFIGNKARIQVF